MKTPCAIPLFTVVCVLTVLAQATNTSLTNSHARRSLERSNRQHHRHAHAGPHRLSAEEAVVYQKKRGVIEDVAADLGLPLPPGPTSSSTTDTASSSSSASASDSASSASITATDSASSSASASDSASSASATDSASSSQSASATDSASSSASATDSASSSPSVTDSASNTASASASPTVTDPPASTSDSPTSSNPPASTATCDPLDLLCTLSSVLSPPTSTPTSDTPASTPAPTSDSSSPTATDPPASTSDSSSPTATDPPASTPAPTSDSPSQTVTDPPASTSDSPTSTDAPASSATCDPLDVVCIGSTILFPSSTPAPTSDTPQTDSSSPTDSATQTASPTDKPVSTTDTPASTSDVVTDIVNTLSSLLPTSTSDKPATQTDSSTPTQSDKPTDTVSQSDQPTQTASQSDQPTQTVSQSDQATQTDTFSGTQTISQPPPTNTVTQTNSDSNIDTKTVTASDSLTDSATESITHTQSVSFPTLTESPTDSEPTATATDSIASASITDSQASVSITTQPIPSEYSYITDSSLALTSAPATPTLSFSLVDPDAAFTTASLTQSGTAAPSQAAAFPTQLPTRIFPANRLDPNDPSLQGMSLVSLKFLNGLTWPFVVSSTNTAALLFVYTPQTIADALGIPVTSVLTFAMQAFAPADYNGDISQLSTVYLLYIPSEQVDALQQQLLTQNSPLYANQAGIPKQISQQLDATFPVNAVGLDTTIVGTGTSSNGSNSGSADASAASRRDAIIGVCAAFGVILVAVVFWWVYKSWRRRQDKAHRRLTHDSAGMHQAGGYGATTQSAYGTVYGAAPQRSGYAQPHTPMYTTTGAPIANPFEDASYEEDPDERRRSFFYAEDSLRGYTVPREEDQGITYTQVVRAQQGLAPNDGKRRAPIQASAISAPILRESSLNW